MIYLNNQLVKFKKFPNNETLLDVSALDTDFDLYEEKIIRMEYEDDQDLINLIFLTDLLGEEFIRDAHLELPYIPYSRMDRQEDENIAFTLKSVTKIINSLKFKKVKVLEPHSNVSLALIDNVKPYYWNSITPELYEEGNLQIIDFGSSLIENVKELINFNEEKDFIYFPDEGACKRYEGKIKANNILVGNKHRNFKTGEIEKLTIQGDGPTSFNFENGHDPKVLMVDDLCSAGGTFWYSSLELQEKFDFKNFYLAVAHCEETIKNGKLLTDDSFKGIFTTTKNDVTTDRNKIVLLNDYFR